MARKSLKPQLNQIRAWVRQGRTDAWIAHQLEVSTSELTEFRRQHDLNPDEGDTGEVDLRDEIEAEVEAAAAEDQARKEAEEAKAAEQAKADAAASDADDESGGEDGEEADGSEAEGRPRRRRRRGRRGGRGRGKAEFEATFDHGEQDGYGLWLDPSVQDSPVYTENWAGNREVKVKIEADQIVIVRADSEDESDD